MQNSPQSVDAIDDELVAGAMDELADGGAETENSADRDRNRSERQLRARRLIEGMLEEKRTRHLAGDDWWDEG